MNLNIDSLLLERMVEDVIFLNGEGQITDFNRASRPWLKCCASVALQLDLLVAGLGMSIVKEIMKIHGDEVIWALPRTHCHLVVPGGLCAHSL